MKIILSKICSLLHVIIVLVPILLRIIYYNVTKYDIYILLFIFLIRFHWFFFKGECIITYFEKKIAVPNYKMGDDIFCSPFGELLGLNKIYHDKRYIFNENYKDLYENFFIILILFINRKSNNFNTMLIIILLSILANLCHNNLYREHLKMRRLQNKTTVSDLIIYS